MLKIYIASDHAGFILKNLLYKYVQQNHEIIDLGPFTEERVDYPVFAKKLCTSVVADPGAFGILICGTGLGMSIAANRFKGIRAVVCACEFHAKAGRQHNDANVLCLGERVTGQGLAMEIAHMFLSTEFEGGRHANRVEMLKD